MERLHLGSTKTDENRSARIHSFEEPSARVLQSSQGQPLRGNNFRRRVWILAIERAELLPSSIHGLR
jgi:hypothetical protein